MPPTQVPFRPCRPTRVGRWLALLCTLLWATLPAVEEAARRHYDIPAGSAVVTLKRAAHQGGLEIVYSAAVVEGVQTQPVAGEFTPREALELMVAHTPLRLFPDPQTGALSIVRSADAPPLPSSQPQPKLKTNAMANKPRTLLAALAGWLALGVAADAQTVPPSAKDAEVVTLNAFSVTGTNIRRLDAEQSLPVTSVSREQINISGGSTPIEFLQNLPSIGAMTVNEGDAKTGVGARGDVAFINLRGLASGNTLVLTNGRRMAPHPISQADGATGSGVGAPSLSVNVNTLTEAAIDHVEVLRDGASAIYGSDASAGVVNNIMARRRDGFTVRTRFGNTFTDDFRQGRVSIFGGKTFNQGRTNFSLAVDYFTREGVRSSARDWADSTINLDRSPAPWNGVPVLGVSNRQQYRSGQFTDYGSFRIGGFSAGFRPTGNTGISTTANGTTVLTASTSGNFFITPTAAAALAIKNTAPSTVDPIENQYYTEYYSPKNNNSVSLIPASDRFSAYATLDHDLTERVSLYADLSAYSSRSHSYVGAVSVGSTVDNPIVVPAANIYNPFGSRFYHPAGLPNADGTPRLTGTPQSVYILNARINPASSGAGFPTKAFDVTSTTYRMLVGLKGKLGADWAWDTGALWSAAHAKDTFAQGALRLSKIREALARPGADALNPFNATFTLGADNLLRINPQPFVNPKSVIDFIASSSDQPSRFGDTALALLDAKADGPLFQLPAGALTLAVGVEGRYEEYVNSRDPYYGINPPGDPNPFLGGPTVADYIGENSDLEINAHRTVFSVFSELSIPVVSAKNKLPLVHHLELSVAGRTEKISDVGTVTKPKYSGVWMPVPWIKLRGSYSESFLAPNLAQTFPGVLVRTANNIADPYRFAVTGLLGDGPTATGRLDLRGGGPSLRPETSTNTSFGVVLSPPGIKGLTITVDFWKLKQKEAISILGATELLLRDGLALDAYVQSQIASGIDVNQLNLGSGTAGYKGTQFINRQPVNADDIASFTAYNATRPAAQQRAPVGSVASIDNDFLNLSQRNLGGVDIEVDYRFPKTALGTFRVNASGAYTSKYEVQTDPTRPFVNFRRQNVTLLPVPLWRGTANLSWRSTHNRWDAGVLAVMLSTYEDINLTTTTAIREALGNPDYISGQNRYIVPAQWFFNATGSYRLAEGRSARRWFGAASIRLGINNILNKEPALTGSGRGFETGGNNLGIQTRTYYVEVTKKL